MPFVEPNFTHADGEPEARQHVAWELLEAGEPEAWNSVVERYAPGIQTYLRCNLPDAGSVDTLLANTFAVALTQARKVPLVSNYAVWLFRVAHNQVIDFWRRHAQTNDPSDSSYLVQRVAAAPFANALSTLLVDERRVLVLHDVVGLSVEEVADVLSRTATAIENILERGREKLEDGIGLQRMVAQ
jgi:RNA polymerase sigma-70 factor (ECF subfamily)